jgi:prevent-host-death family protein
MTTASISEAKAKLSALLDRVKAGETVTITDRGVPVARIVPLNGASEVDWDARLERLEDTIESGVLDALRANDLSARSVPFIDSTRWRM